MKYIKIVFWSEAAGILLVRLHWYPAVILDLIPAAAVFPLIVLLWKSYPSRWESADFFDRLFNRKSIAVNALEITERQAPETPFAAYAVELALAQLKNWRGKIPLENPIRKRDVIPLLAVAAALFCPLPHPGMTVPAGKTILPIIPAEQEKSGGKPDRTIRRKPELRPENARRNEKTGRNGQYDFGPGQGTGSSRGTGRTEEKIQGGGTGRTDGGFEGNRSGMKGSGTPRRQEQVFREKPRKTESKTAGGMNGSGGMDGEEESGAYAGMSAGQGGGSMSQTHTTRRRKEVNRKKTEHRGGFQPLLPDRSPQAGRKAAEGDEHGDSPGTGRGGDTGAKKSRGAAASLPVLPRPDTVTGRLGAGEDITSIDRSLSGCNTLPGRFGESSGSAETEAPYYALSASLRRKIRYETERTMSSKEKNK